MKISVFGFPKGHPAIISLFAALSFLISLTSGSPQSGKGSSAVLYDDSTGTSYDHSSLAAHLNQRLSTVPRLHLINGNEAHAVMEERKDKEPSDPPPPPPPPMKLDKWLRYKQVYYNPYYYGGQNRGPPVFVPQFGLWPRY